MTKKDDTWSQVLPAPTEAILESISDGVFTVDLDWRITSFNRAAEQITGYTLGQDDNSDLALRVLAEHARTMTFLISDSVFPSNEDRGFVLRRIMRRAIRFAYLLGVEDLVTGRLVDKVVEIMGPDYPQLVTTHELVRSVVEREETQFRKTLAAGSNILDEELAKIESGGELPGSVAFLLHDTYGFPFEVTAEVVAERGFSVDRAGFESDMADQRTRAKEARKGVVQAADFEQVQALVEANGQTDFVGRDEVADVEASVLLVTGIGTDSVSEFSDRTPMYAESGGQIGDTGTIVTETGTAYMRDTVYAVPGVHRHVIDRIDGEILAGQPATISIDVARRDAIRRNHTGTHLLHWALGQVLGDHVKQQGSMVGPDRLRFDFSHFDPVTPEQIAQIEDMVNEQVLANPGTEHPEVTKAEAERMGAIAFFGDKYGDMVRVLRAGPTLEFCGGTHVSAPGDIGLIKIVSESSIGSNLRRVEAVTGAGAVDLLRSEQAVVDGLASQLGVPRGDLADGLTKRLDELSGLKAELKALQGKLAMGQAVELAESATDGVVVARIDGMSRDQLKELAVAIRDRDEVTTVVLGGEADGGGAALVAAVVPGEGPEAGALIADGAKAIKGGGGKGADLAMAGGKDPGGVDEALDLARQVAGIGS
jgi:alanyl-tRNA synthetase